MTTIPLKLIAANDTFGALVALGDALAGTQAVFVTAPEVNGLMPEVHGLPDQVDSNIALIVESSGSTGTPKRIYLSRDAIVASAQASAAALGGHGQWLLALPINFVAGANVLIRSLAADSQPVMMNTSLPFTAEAFARSASLMNGARRYTSLVPAQLDRLVKAAALDDFLVAQVAKFDAILVGGQAASPQLVSKARALGWNIVVSYGMTETGGGCVYDGLPLPGVELRLDPNGVIEIAGATLAQDVATNGWFHTSDLGQFSTDGRLQVLGRNDRVLISGGLKVSLDAIEAKSLELGGVVEAAALAVTDDHWGQRAALVYVGSPEVADYAAEQILEALGPAGKPVRVVRVAQIPKLVSGKTDYLALKALLAS